MLPLYQRWLISIITSQFGFNSFLLLLLQLNLQLLNILFSNFTIMSLLVLILISNSLIHQFKIITFLRKIINFLLLYFYFYLLRGYKYTRCILTEYYLILLLILILIILIILILFTFVTLFIFFLIISFLNLFWHSLSICL